MRRQPVMKRIAAWATTGLLALSLVPMQAFAGPVVTDRPLDKQISVSGLDNGDAAYYYQIVEQYNGSNGLYEYKPASKFISGVDYYTKNGVEYSVATGVTADNFSPATYYTREAYSQTYRVTTDPTPVNGTTYYTYVNQQGYIKANVSGSFDSNTTYYVRELTPMNDWQLTELVDNNRDGVIDLTEGGLNFTIHDIVITDANSSNKAVITKDIANAIAAAVASNSTGGVIAKGAANEMAVSNGTATKAITDDKAGVYMVLGIAADAQTLYKPIFVSADYDANDTTNTLALVTKQDPQPAGTTPSDYYGDPNAPQVFKKSKLTIVKESGIAADPAQSIEADPQRDVAVGDTVHFKITVPIPTYTDDYQLPFFMVSDRVSAGLNLNEDVRVTVAGYNDFNVAPDHANEMTVKYDTILTDEKTWFTVVFNESFLKRVVGAPTATITYTATVTSPALYQVNQMDNTSALTFSKDATVKGPSPTKNDPNNPGSVIDDPEYPNDLDYPKTPDPTNPDKQDTTDPTSPKPTVPTPGTSTLTDKTRHYTFGIDANVLKPDNNTPDPTGNPLDPVPSDKHSETKEIEKVGIAANGTVDERTIQARYPDGDADSTTPSTTEAFGPLGGATFHLRTVLDDDSSSIKFKNNVKDDANGSVNVVSNPDGSITMRGLDAGTYYLFETACPIGYSFDPSIYYTIVIAPTYVDDALGNQILESYTVTTTNSATGQSATSTYTVEKESQDQNAKPVSFLNNSGQLTLTDTPITLTSTAGTMETSIIVNKLLGILPATGGSGIFFYLFCGAGIMAAAVMLTKAKIKADKKARPAA